jgi:hypothetical protein
VDPGVPKLSWAGLREIQVYGHHAVLNGFRFGGHYSKAGGPSKPFDKPNGVYSYDDNHPGFSMPNLHNRDTAMWVAVFASSRPGTPTAGVSFMPFLRVVSHDKDTGLMKFNSSVGEMEADFFVGAEALVIQEGGFFSNKVVKITANTADSVTLPAGLSLAADDYVLPAPGPEMDYKYLCSLKLDHSPGATRPPYNSKYALEWRNFAFRDNMTYSATGRPHPDIRNPAAPVQIDFRHHVSPLATGVIVVGQAISEAASDSGAYLALSHDSSRHEVAHFGVGRAPVNGMCTLSNGIVGFGRVQSLWATISRKGVIGRVIICGWVE